jgi:hypothetical protein
MNRMDEVHGLLSGLLNTFATAQSLMVKWEGQASDPSTSTYLREWLLPGESTGLALGSDAPNATPLIYQVDIVSAIAGWGPAYAIAKEFFGTSYFYRGRFFENTANTTRITLRKGQVGPAMREDTKYVLPMSVNLRAYTII